ncbi:hypothetical protein COLO4_38525 [Corchorus olitorius]|uniref:Uncharacterized protein n=1 Tax=Corchorus olitorius TaxID=93759 RepID=A0A1R3FUD6_9ROSI|nr:hypothetical protein COLO4_38525 [Corchorus olitorius]
MAETEGLSENAEIEELNQRLLKLIVRIEIAKSSILTGDDWKTRTESLVEELTKELTNLKEDFVDGAYFCRSNGSYSFFPSESLYLRSEKKKSFRFFS